MRGDILFIPTAASENAINASWLIILWVQNDGLGFPCSTCSICNMGSSTMGTCFGVMLAVFLSALRFSFNFFSRSLFSFLEFIFPHSFGHPLNLLLRGKTLCHLPYFLLVLVVVLV